MTNLQRIRKENGLTQRELAEKSGVNLKMIRKYEQGVQNINRASVTTVINLILALGCEIHDILEPSGAGYVSPDKIIGGE